MNDDDLMPYTDADVAATQHIHELLSKAFDAEKAKAFAEMYGASTMKVSEVEARQAYELAEWEYDLMVGFKDGTYTYDEVRLLMKEKGVGIA